MIWTHEADARILRYRDEGLSCADAAVRMGPSVTRNMIIGRLHRLDSAERRKQGLSVVREHGEVRAAGKYWGDMTSPEKNAAIAKGVGDLLSVNAIATRHGTYSKAIVAHAKRRGLSLGASTSPVGNSAARKVRAARTRYQPHVASPTTAMVVVPVRFVVPRETIPAVSGQPVRFVDRSAFQCAWIDADPRTVPLLCCGLPVARRHPGEPAWCGAHQRIGHDRHSDRRARAA